MLIYCETTPEGGLETRRLSKGEDGDPYSYQIQVQVYEDPSEPDAIAAQAEWDMNGDQRLPAPEVPQPALNVLVDFSNVPAGTLIRITNEEGDVFDFPVEDGAMFADPGTYKVLISTPITHQCVELVWEFSE